MKIKRISDIMGIVFMTILLLLSAETVIFAEAGELPPVDIGGDHTHTASSTWSADKTNHWHVCTVCGEKCDIALHNWDGGKTDSVTGVVTYTCTVCRTTKTEDIAKKDNTLKITNSKKTYKRSKLKKKAAFTVTASKARGKVSCSLSAEAKKAGFKVKKASYKTSKTVTAKYKITVPKKCKKGIYKITVRAAGNDTYKVGTKTVTVKVK